MIVVLSFLQTMSTEEFAKLPHFLYDYVKQWADEKPEELAIIDADTHQYFSWREFDNAINMVAFQLVPSGMTASAISEDGSQQAEVAVVVGFPAKAKLLNRAQKPAS